MYRGKSFLLFIFLLVSSLGFSQSSGDLKEWHLRDKQSDTVEGISLSKTYTFLKNKKSTPVIVAVIDSGVDTTHEDLKRVLWRNPKEIPGNGKDDDGNGYVDDIYGWNFLGGKDGKNIKDASTEVARVYHRYKDKFLGKDINIASLSPEEKDQYVLWKQADSLINNKSQDGVELMFIEMTYKAAKKYEKTLQEEMKKEEFTLNEVEQFRPETQQGKRAKMAYITFLKLTNIDADEKNTALFNELEQYIDEKKQSADAKDKAPENVRAEIVKDDYNNLNDRYYGNNDVMGPTSMHGTHVSGIIAADRNNGIGADGIADNVKIMMVRAVPDGDEYDKDVSLAIRYAVDNGAKVINMSFGKELSPEKKWVDEAVKYAELKDVLIVHAAGNDAENTDSVGNYPNPYLKSTNKIAANFITVGASSDPKVSGSYIADFSNYGKHTVDVLAPGVKIYSTLPGSAYGFEKGTSMASPVVAGIAALIRSYFPSLSAKQVKYVIEKSADVDTSLVVALPGTQDKMVKLADLSTSGGFVNAYKAVKMAAELQNDKQQPKKPTLPARRLPPATFKNTAPKQ